MAPAKRVCCGRSYGRKWSFTEGEKEVPVEVAIAPNAPAAPPAVGANNGVLRERASKPVGTGVEEYMREEEESIIIEP